MRATCWATKARRSSSSEPVSGTSKAPAIEPNSASARAPACVPDPVDQDPVRPGPLGDGVDGHRRVADLGEHSTVASRIAWRLSRSGGRPGPRLVVAAGIAGTVPGHTSGKTAACRRLSPPARLQRAGSRRVQAAASGSSGANRTKPPCDCPSASDGNVVAHGVQTQRIV